MKKYLLITLVFLFIFTSFGSGSKYVQFGMVSENYTSMLMLNDWQMDYLMPIDPAELSKGEYRIYGTAAKLNYNSNYGTVTKGSGTNYIVGFDTALRDNLYFHISYDIVPWQATMEDEKEELRFDMLKMFLDYKFQKDKKVYFGFNSNISNYKEFDEDTNSFFEEEKMGLNLFYVGFEIKSSFNR